MAKIQIDFDQVMQFGDLHGDIGRALHSRRATFRHDSVRLDQIIDAFGLQRVTGNPHFQGLTIAAAMGDADARAGRVADSLIKTSSRIFNHAGSYRDDHFNWAGAAFGAVGAALIGPFGVALLGSVGGELAGIASSGIALGSRLSPLLGPALPVFSGVVGVLDLVDGVSGLLTPGRDGWSMVSSGMKVVAGTIGVVIGVVGAGLIVALGSGAAATVAVAAAPFLAAGAVLSFGALLIDERETVGRLVADAGRAVGGAFRAVVTTATEAAHDLLDGAGDVWGQAVSLVRSASVSVVDAAFTGVETVRSTLSAVGSQIGPLQWTPLAATRSSEAVPSVGGAIAATLSTALNSSASQRPQRTPGSTRLDSPESRAAVLAQQGAYLSAAPGARERLPGAFAVADAWYSELLNGATTAAQVAAFESYMAMIKLADTQVIVVREAATHAHEQFVQAGEAGASAIGTAVGVTERSPQEFSDYLFEQAVDFDSELIGGALSSELVELSHIEALGAEAMVMRYVLDADQLLVGMAEDFRGIDRVGYNDPYDLAKLQYERFDDMRQIAADKGLLADAFTPLTGDGSGLDLSLRAGLKIVGGPAAKATLDGLGIVGGTAKAGYHIDSGTDSLYVAASGIDSLRAASLAFLL